jgi:hypothetical protein
MRSRGVPDFPDPGSGAFALVPAGVNPSAPAFRAASSACGHLLPQLHPPQQASAEARGQLLKFSNARAHTASPRSLTLQTRLCLTDRFG